MSAIRPCLKSEKTACSRARLSRFRAPRPPGIRTLTVTQYSVAIAIAAILLVALRWPNLGSSTLRAAETSLYLFAERRWLAIFSVAFLAMAANAAIALATRIPQPWVSDEFAHLLAADTFASGRLSNPTHPMWTHFESAQILQKPTYVSKYPPAQGLILAVGQIVSGQPIAGVWLSAGLTCGAICWMLQGWFRPGVALIGALLAVFRIGVTTYWSRSYWGGMMAALGGALVFGAMRRILSRPRAGSSVVLGAGLAILANSRPYEGLLASLPVFVVLVYQFFRSGTPERRQMLRRVAMPVCAMGLLTLLWMGYYNFRQTGNPLINAYQVYTATYQLEPIFAWQRFREPPLAQHPIVHQNDAGKAVDSAQYELSRRAAAPKVSERLLILWAFFCTPALTIPLLVALVSMRSFVWCALASVVAVVGGLLLGSMWIFPHYAAPIAGPFFVVLTYGWSRLRAFRVGQRRTGLLVARIIAIFCVALLAVRVAALCAGIKPETRHGPLVASLTNALSGEPPVAEWPYLRAAMERQLARFGVENLILVRYKEQEHPNLEWVYNRADIDGAPVVWAHELDPGSNQKLIDYFRNRRVWLLDADETPPKLTPYAAFASTGAIQPPDSDRQP